MPNERERERRSEVLSYDAADFSDGHVVIRGTHPADVLPGKHAQVDRTVILETGANVRGSIHGARVKVQPGSSVQGSIYGRDVVELIAGHQDPVRCGGQVAAHGTVQIVGAGVTIEGRAGVQVAGNVFGGHVKITNAIVHGCVIGRTVEIENVQVGGLVVQRKDSSAMGHLTVSRSDVLAVVADGPVALSGGTTVLPYIRSHEDTITIAEPIGVALYRAVSEAGPRFLTAEDVVLASKGSQVNRFGNVRSLDQLLSKLDV